MQRESRPVIRPYRPTYQQEVLATFTRMYRHTMDYWRVSQRRTAKTAYKVVARLTCQGNDYNGSYTSGENRHAEIDALSQIGVNALIGGGAVLTTDTNPCKRCAVIIALYNALSYGPDGPFELDDNPNLVVHIPSDRWHFHEGYAGGYNLTPDQAQALALWVGARVGMNPAEIAWHKTDILNDFYALSGTQ